MDGQHRLTNLMTPNNHPLQRLIQYTKLFRSTMLWATICSILNKIFDLAPPILIGLTVDVVIKKENSFLAHWGIIDTHAQLWAMSIITIVIWVLESVFQYAYDLLWRNLAQAIQHQARIDAYAHVQSLEMAYFEERSTGGLMSILNDDVNQLERFLNSGANELIQVIITVLFIGGYYFVIAPDIAIWAMLPMPIIIYGSMRYQKYLAPLYTRVREEVGLLNGQLSNNLSGIATIKSYTAEEYEIGRISAHSDAYQNANRRAIQVSSSYIPLIRMAIMAGFIAMTLLGGWRVLNGTLDVGLYSTIVYMTQRLLWPLTRLGETFDQYQRAMASISRLLDLIDTPATIISGQHHLPKSEMRGAITFENVSFSYSNGLAVLHNISMEIPAGHTIALVGSTGGGKSTVIKLLMRFYDVSSGRVLVDGIDVRDLDLHDLREGIGLVSQDVYLFHGTARENIAYGTFDASTSAIVKAAEVGEAHEFISHLPQGYETIVGERGQKLSGGQRQRISIARAVLKNPPILILDEATSSVDNETEAAIQRSMEKIAIGRTTIIIAHRLSTVRNADTIYVLDGGRIAEQGNHDQLVARGGLYAELWRIQTGAKRLPF